MKGILWNKKNMQMDDCDVLKNGFHWNYPQINVRNQTVKRGLLRESRGTRATPFASLGRLWSNVLTSRRDCEIPSSE